MGEGRRRRRYFSLMLAVAVSLLGLGLVLFVLYDVTHTTLRLSGGGMLTNLVIAAVWGLLLAIDRRVPSREVLNTAGVTILLASIVTWTALLWLGWLLVFLPHDGAVLSSPEGIPADFWSRVYFVGYSVITLGVGDFAPHGGAFQVATTVAAITGFFLVTLSVTYLIAVVSAVLEARQLAEQVFLIGDDPASLIVNTREEHANHELVRVARTLVAPVVRLSQHHFAFPVLRYFRSRGREGSAPVGLAVLDEALTLLTLAIDDDPRTNPVEVLSIRRAIERHLLMLERHFLEGTAPAPPAPPLADLHEAGIETVPEEEFHRRIDLLRARRRLLHTLVQQEGRTWQHVTGKGGSR